MTGNPKTLPIHPPSLAVLGRGDPVLTNAVRAATEIKFRTVLCTDVAPGARAHTEVRPYRVEPRPVHICRGDPLRSPETWHLVQRDENEQIIEMRNLISLPRPAVLFAFCSGMVYNVGDMSL
jgi:hypothetical protein